MMIINPNYGDYTSITYSISGDSPIILTDQNHIMKLRGSSMDDYRRLAAVCKYAKELQGYLLVSCVNITTKNLILVYNVPWDFSHLCFKRNNELVVPDQEVEYELNYSNGIPIDFTIESNEDALVSIVSMPYIDEKCDFLDCDLAQAIQQYTEGADNAATGGNVDGFVCYDKARAICKWANDNATQILKQQVKDGVLHLTFGFPSKEKLDTFCRYAALGAYYYSRRMDRFVILGGKVVRYKH